MADVHIARPDIWIQRRLAKMQFPTQDDARHLETWMSKYLKSITPDPRNQAAAAIVAWNYAQLVAAESKTIGLDLLSPEHDILLAKCIKLQGPFLKALRTAVVRPSGRKHKSRQENADIFTAPRGRRPSEVEADELSPHGDAA